MSSITHRIFISKHKHKKKVFGWKKKYKKFLGLKTLKAVLYTKLSLPYKAIQNKKVVKKVRAKKRVIKKPVIKKRVIKTHTKLVTFPILKLLSPTIRRQEVTLAQGDIARFKSIISENAEKPLTEEKFQAFVPQNV